MTKCPLLCYKITTIVVGVDIPDDPPSNKTIYTTNQNYTREGRNLTYKSYIIYAISSNKKARKILAFIIF